MKTSSAWRGMRLCALGCVMLLTLTTAAYAKTFSGKKPKFDESKLGRQVMYPGIGEPVWVAGLYGAAGTDPKYADKRLPYDIVDKLIRARDRNAFWLICEDRRDYSSIAYTYVFANNSGLATHVRGVEGPYGRGVYFKVPSEYVLFQCNVSACTYKNEDGYFKMIMEPVPKGEHGISKAGLPDYIKWADAFRVCRGTGWMNLRTLVKLDAFRTKEDFVNGAELWFDEDDLRLVKEIITEPTALEDGSGWDYSQAVPVKEVEYNYTDYSDIERDFPKHVIVRENGVVRLEMEFKLADGFWMLHRGKLFSGSPDDENYHAFGFNTVGIVVKR